MIKSKDIFLVEYYNYHREPKQHYFYCIYNQKQDMNNKLQQDVIGLLITTNNKYKKLANDYNVKIKIGTKECFVCCDKIYRFSKEEIKDVKGDLLDEKEKAEIRKYYESFIKETFKQMK